MPGPAACKYGAGCKARNCKYSHPKGGGSLGVTAARGSASEWVQAAFGPAPGGVGWPEAKRAALCAALEDEEFFSAASVSAMDRDVVDAIIKAAGLKTGSAGDFKRALEALRSASAVPPGTKLLLEDLPEEQALRKAFKYFDTDKNGCLDLREFTAMMQGKGGKALSGAEMEACLAAVDSNGNGLVEEDEYVAWVLDKPYEDPMVTHSILAGIAAIAVVVESDEPVAKNQDVSMKAKAPSTASVHMPTPGGGGAVSLKGVSGSSLARLETLAKGVEPNRCHPDQGPDSYGVSFGIDRCCHPFHNAPTNIKSGKLKNKNAVFVNVWWCGNCIVRNSCGDTHCAFCGAVKGTVMPEPMQRQMKVRPSDRGGLPEKFRVVWKQYGEIPDTQKYPRYRMYASSLKELWKPGSGFDFIASTDGVAKDYIQEKDYPTWCHRQRWNAYNLPTEAGFASKSSVSAMDRAGWPKTGSSYTMLNRGSGKIVEVEEVRVDASTGAMGAHKFQPGVDTFFVCLVQTSNLSGQCLGIKQECKGRKGDNAHGCGFNCDRGWWGVMRFEIAPGSIDQVFTMGSTGHEKVCANGAQFPKNIPKFVAWEDGQFFSVTDSSDPRGHWSFIQTNTCVNWRDAFFADKGPKTKGWFQHDNNKFKWHVDDHPPGVPVDSVVGEFSGTPGRCTWCGWQHATPSGHMVEMSAWVKFVGAVPSRRENFGFKIQGKTCNEWVEQCKPDEWKFVKASCKSNPGGDHNWNLFIFDPVPGPITVRFAQMKLRVVEDDGSAVSTNQAQQNQLPCFIDAFNTKQEVMDLVAKVLQLEMMDIGKTALPYEHKDFPGPMLLHVFDENTTQEYCNPFVSLRRFHDPDGGPNPKPGTKPVGAGANYYVKRNVNADGGHWYQKPCGWCGLSHLAYIWHALKLLGKMPKSAKMHSKADWTRYHPYWSFDGLGRGNCQFGIHNKCAYPAIGPDGKAIKENFQPGAIIDIDGAGHHYMFLRDNGDGTILVISTNTLKGTISSSSLCQFPWPTSDPAMAPVGSGMSTLVHWWEPALRAIEKRSK